MPYEDNLELYEVDGRSFESQYRGTCVINRDHEVKRGDKVARVKRTDNPLIPVAGVACKSCTRMLKS